MVSNGMCTAWIWAEMESASFSAAPAGMAMSNRIAASLHLRLAAIDISKQFYGRSQQSFEVFNALRIIRAIGDELSPSARAEDSQWNASDLSHDIPY
jgi:hypothetical protein